MKMTRRTFVAATAATVAAPAIAAPRARLVDRYWTGTGTAAAPDHSAWDAILRAHMQMGSDGIARFDYARAPKASVDAYVASLAAIDPTTLRGADAFAYWVNLYNALTVATVLAAYPVASIRDIGGGLFSSGPWKQDLVTVAGRRLSLDDIEHGILRPIWRDPRVHYAVNCASLGCPNLRSRAYRGGNLDAALTEAARAFINHPRGARIDRGRLIVSSIYHWFKADFGGSDAGVVDHLKRFASQPKALDGIDRISDHGYDWRLNGVRP